jgi:hypothetical protein
MRMKGGLMVLPALALASLLSHNPAAAQAASPAHTHLGHVADAFRDTPEGKGFVTTAMAEAKIAADHAALAGSDPTNLDAMKRHAGHVINAIDPTEVAAGPGLKYGMKKAAAAAVQHIEMAAADPSASAAMKTHATHIATSSRNTIARADKVLALARQVQAATAAAEAAALVAQMNDEAALLLPGQDANNDGSVGWQEGEGGLDTAQRHVGLLKTAEGLP